MRTTRELRASIGQQVHWKQGKLSVLMDVLDARTMYGRIDILIQPVSGAGQQWVSADSCETVKPSVEQPKETPP